MSVQHAPEPMADAYVECALWSSLAWPYGPDETLEPIPADEVHCWDDVDEDVRAVLLRDLAEFVQDNATDLAASGLDDVQIGCDFWLTRNRHGAGFWDRGLPGDIGRRLTDAAEAYGEADLGLSYVLDSDGEVHPA